MKAANTPGKGGMSNIAMGQVDSWYKIRLDGQIDSRTDCNLTPAAVDKARVDEKRRSSSPQTVDGCQLQLPHREQKEKHSVTSSSTLRTWVNKRCSRSDQ